MTARKTPHRRRTQVIEHAAPRRLTLNGHTFQCYDQQHGRYSLVVMEERIIYLSASTYHLFIALLERAAQPSPDAIVPMEKMLRVAMLGEDDAWARRALRKRLYVLRSKITAFGLEVSCVQEQHAAVGYMLRSVS